MNKNLYYNDIALVPRFSPLSTRKEADVSANLSNSKFRLPVIPSNMKCVIDEKKAKWFSENDYMYVMHRFDVSTYDFVKDANIENWKNISISVGVKEDDYDLINCLYADELRVNYITIDIAHGHSALMRDMIYHIKSKLKNVYIIAGNVCTPTGFDDLCNWGADAVKVGIGPGAACTTKLKTGFTYPMFSCIKNIQQNSEEYSNKILIADGGITYNGDISKAINAGADFVMCGKLFSECLDSPSPVDSLGHKMYFGSASIHNKNHKNNIEGTLIPLPTNNMTYEQKLQEIEQDLQSAVSYSGGNTLSDIRRVDYILI